MKEKLYLAQRIAMILIAFGILTFSNSCKDDDKDEPKEEKTVLTVNGSSIAKHTFPGLFDGGKGIDYKQSFKINSSEEWTLNNNADWLNVSPTSGSGDVDVVIYPTKENKTDQERVDSLILASSDVRVTIYITQKAGKPVCKVVPKNEVALYDCVAWEYEATPNVNDFQYIVLKESAYKRLTENELISMIQQEERLKYADEYLTGLAYDSDGNSIEDETTYYFASLAYNKDGEAGMLQEVKIKTPPYYNYNDDAWVSFDNVEANLSEGFWFDTKKEGYCNTYHMIYGISDSYYNKAVFAFEINYYLKNNKTKHWLAENEDMEIVTDYPNNHTFTYYTYYLPLYPICFAYGWGIFKDGKLSSDILGFSWDTSSSEVIQNRSKHNKIELTNFVIERSKVEQRTKQAHLNK